jgi:high affinity sulfate transporter 1
MSRRGGVVTVSQRGARYRLLTGVLPIDRSRLLPDALAGATLAALAVPEVMGYARIAGMPVVTGLYTMLLPLAVFAVLGSSRHLVVGADSATAAMLAAGLAAVAVPGSPRYVVLAGTSALLVAGLLVVARLLRLGFLANFLSRTVLVGFLTGVGIEVATTQLADLLGVPSAGDSTPAKLLHVLRELPRAQVITVLVSLAVIVIVVGIRMIGPRLPGALIAVVAATTVSQALHLQSRGVAVLGAVPAGLPHLALPSVAVPDLLAMLPVAASMMVVILAQSAATSRAYAARYGEQVDTDVDIVGLGAANLAAAVSGAFVVNGSPTKTQMVDSAGGRSQLSQLSAGAVVLVVLLALTGPLAALPLAALAAVVFLIGIDLIDVAGMRRIYTLRREEFVVAVLTAIAVIVLGVEQGVLVAVVASVVDHLRHSYEPRSSVLEKSPEGHWRSCPVAPGARTADGLVIYRFGTSLYFANASRLAEDVTALLGSGAPVRWFCLDGAAIGDVDYTAASVLAAVHTRLSGTGTRLVLSNIIDPVRTQLDRYGFGAEIGTDGYYETSGQVLEDYEATGPGGATRTGPADPA